MAQADAGTIDGADLARRRAAWEAAGVALAHSRDAWFRPGHPDGPDRLQPAAPLLDGVPRAGDLVLLCGAGPDAPAQDLRRVEAIEESPYGGAPALRLSRPVPRAEWPGALHEASAPLVLPVRDAGDGACLLGEGGEPILLLPGTTAARLAEIVALVSAQASDDVEEGRMRGFSVARGALAGRRAWILSDDDGTAIDAAPRGLLDRRPPEGLAGLRAAAGIAYRAARADAALRHARALARAEAAADGPDDATPGLRAA